MRGGTIDRLAATASVSRGRCGSGWIGPRASARPRRRAPPRTSTWAWPSACGLWLLPRRRRLARLSALSPVVGRWLRPPRRSSTRRCRVIRDGGGGRGRRGGTGAARPHREERRHAGFRASPSPEPRRRRRRPGRRSRSPSRSMRCRSVRGRDRRDGGASWARRCHRVDPAKAPARPSSPTSRRATSPCRCRLLVGSGLPAGLDCLGGAGVEEPWAPGAPAVPWARASRAAPGRWFAYRRRSLGLHGFATWGSPIRSRRRAYPRPVRVWRCGPIPRILRFRSNPDGLEALGPASAPPGLGLRFGLGGALGAGGAGVRR